MAHIKKISLKKSRKVFRLCARFTTDYFDYKVSINSLLTDKNLHQLCRAIIGIKTAKIP